MLQRQGYGPEEIQSQVWLKEIRKENHAAHRRRSATTTMNAAAATVASNNNTHDEDDGECVHEDSSSLSGVPHDVMVYDHAQCNDCGVVHSMVTECVMQLAAKTLQVVMYFYMFSLVESIYICGHN